MKALGLSVSIDAIGNVTGVYHGGETLPMVMIRVTYRYRRHRWVNDGNYGVMAGLEVVPPSGCRIRTRRPLAVTFFTNEEGAISARYDGQRGVCQQYPLAQALAAKDLDSITLDEALRNIGYKGERQPGDMAVDSYVELHIEQGPILDKEQIDIGVVTGVQGISWQEFTLRGVSNHAGTNPNVRET